MVSHNYRLTAGQQPLAFPRAFPMKKIIASGASAAASAFSPPSIFNGIAAQLKPVFVSPSPEGK